MTDSGTEELTHESDLLRGLELRVKEGPDVERAFVRAGTEPVAIGTHPSNPVALTDRTVSRFHCELALEGDTVRVTDLGSRNGTFVDGVRVERAGMKPGTTLQVGRTPLSVRAVGARTSEPPLRPSRFGQLVGRSRAMRGVVALLERAVGVTSTVLIEGETGTGKDVAARAIHERGPRARGPFEVVDCTALPEELLESELFGHERGAFTGAHARHEGAFARAHGGTLFLDEIGELPTALQPKLLRAIEQRAIRPLGGSTTRMVDVRIVVATNRDLRVEVNEGRFRPDLYYRLAVLRVVMPPLRARGEDLPDLVADLLEALDAPADLRAELERPEAARELARQPWPGNVRELRNHLERCIALRDVVVEHAEAPLAPERVEDLAARPYTEARDHALDLFERDYVRALLAHHEGNVLRAAAAAGLSRSYLHKLLARHRP